MTNLSFILSTLVNLPDVLPFTGIFFFLIAYLWKNSDRRLVKAN